VIKSAVFFAADVGPFTKRQAAYSVLFIYNASIVRFANERNQRLVHRFFSG
jgi:hypothetical protein